MTTNGMRKASISELQLIRKGGVPMKQFKMDRNFAIGSDISWYPQMLESGFVFKNKDGKEQDLLLTLKEFNHNAIRLRTWVNPSDNPQSGHCSAQETKDFAIKCRNEGSHETI